MSEDGEGFLRRELAELANRGRGHFNLFENDQGEINRPA
jgi:hypothetical protein